MLRAHDAIVVHARRKLSRCAGLRYTTTPTSVLIPPPHEGGFAIQLRVRRRGYVVQLDGWRRVFGRDDDALDCVEFALSDSCRLLIEYRGRTPVAWTVEAREYGTWVPHHRCARRLVPFWRARRTEYRQNRVRFQPWESIKAAAAGE